MTIPKPQAALASDAFRLFQAAVVPGLDGLHRAMQSILDDRLQAGATLLVVGAGGGHELQTLGASDRAYNFVRVDPSAQMLEIARVCVAARGPDVRTTLIEGVVDDLPHETVFDAATSLFVMHFLPRDGSKRSFLTSIRRASEERCGESGSDADHL